eukprot:PLAT14431.1.p1 GENE.PLAT14431.1~~PLAT14431.1.p1  ORF type:complete len:138 (+),score=47.61 PLAT14431.1:107-520(+)
MALDAPAAAYLGVDEVATLLNGDEADKVLVLDVRDDDFHSYGHIKVAQNVPSVHWDDDDQLDKLLPPLLAGKSTVIVHCMMSKMRAVFAAGRLTAFLSRWTPEGEEEAVERSVYIMTGGFRAWMALKEDDPLTVSTP